jgi:hypothetical protein
MRSIRGVSLFRPGKGLRNDVEVRHPSLYQRGWPERTASVLSRLLGFGGGGAFSGFGGEISSLTGLDKTLRTAASVHCRLSGQLAVRLRLGTCLSDAFSQEMGFSQGSIMSVSLFTLKINSIGKCLPNAVIYSLYIEEFLVAFGQDRCRQWSKRCKCV